LTAEIAKLHTIRNGQRAALGEGCYGERRCVVRLGNHQYRAHSDYREQAVQFRQWAADETVPEARDGLLDMARQYERLAKELEARIATQRPNVPSC